MVHFSNVIIHGGTINSAQGDININNRNSESGLHTLRLASSLGAVHDSAERCPPPNCHPDTRKAARQIILDWIHDDSAASRFFWLYGAPGVGKTAILQAIAEFLCSPSEFDGKFGGSFFFSRGKNGRDQGHFLFLTIAYQLALKVPGLRQHVNRIMEVNQELHTKSMTVQLQNLIVDAFRSLSPLPQRSYLVIIDGLDECHGKATQQSILRLLCETITIHKLPLRFLIGSRPESHIRDSFDQKSLYTITRRVVLDETFNPRRDIQVFLQDGFAKLCANNSILAHVEQPWPAKGIIDLLVKRSSGQFIYAATVLKFVGADFCSPTKQLELILKTDPAAFSDLDQLYTQILSVYPSTVNIVQILGIILAFGDDDLTPKVIEDILGMEEGELKLLLRGVSSVIAFVGDENGEYLTKEVVSNVGRPYFVHASFGDYLVDPTRSGQFHVNKQKSKDQAIIRSFSLITKSIGRSWRIPHIARLPRNETWNYFIHYLAADFIASPKLVKEAIMIDIDDLLQEFWKISESSGGVVDVFFTPMRCLLKIYQKLAMDSRFTARPWDLDETKSKHLKSNFETQFDRYRKMLDQSFSKSRELGDLLRFLPGIVVQNDLPLQGMVSLYRVKMDLLERLIKSTIEPLTPFQVSPYSLYALEDYLSGFLRDRDRSHLYYCDPILHHISICRHFLSLLDGSNVSDLQSYDLSAYVQSHLYDHLCAATMGFGYGQNILDDHPAVQILNDLETTTYYIDAQSSQSYYLAQCIIEVILRWANMLKGVGQGLVGRVCQLTNKIYREILCITKDGNFRTVALDGSNRFQVGVFQVGVCPRTSQYRILLSWNLLSWISVEGRIPSSFTYFITNPELSGSLYITPDVYYTQITEYSLETIFRSNHFLPSPFSLYNCFLPSPDWSFVEHFSRALPTEMIFYLLRSIPSRRLVVCDDNPKTMLNFLEIMIKWLEGLDSKRPSDLYDRFQREFLYYKALFEL